MFIFHRAMSGKRVKFDRFCLYDQIDHADWRHVILYCESDPFVSSLQKRIIQALPFSSTAFDGSASYSMPKERFYVYHFRAFAAAFARKNADLINMARECHMMNDVLDSQSVLALREQLVAELKNFVDKTKKNLSSDRLICLLALVEFEQADEATRNLNWVLEEIAAYYREICFDRVFVMSHCTMKDGEALVTTDNEQGRIVNALTEHIRGSVYGSRRDVRPKASIEGNLLTSYLDYPQGVKVISANFRLLLNGEQIDSVWSNKTKRYQWTLTQSGIYVVRVHFSCADGRGYRNADPVEFFTQEDRSEYQSLLTENTETDLMLGAGVPPLRQNKAPYDDFVIMTGQQAAAIDSACETLISMDNRFHEEKSSRWAEQSYRFLTTGALKATDAGDVLLSGLALIKGRVTEGSEQLDSSVTRDDLLHQMGTHTIVLFESDRCTISRDYFQSERIYYYHDDNMTVVTNCYHLLLLSMRALAIPCELDTDKAAASLVMAGTYVLSCNFSSKMDITKARQLPQYLDIVLNEKGCTLVTNACGKMMEHKSVYHEELYRKQLQQARRQLVENTQNCVNTSQYDVYVANLTGGFDTRLVFGALVSQPVNKKILVNTKEYSHRLDAEIGAAMNALYPHQYLSQGTEFRVISTKDADMYLRSNDLGICYEHGSYTGRLTQNNQRRIVITGVNGEIVTRPFKTIRLMSDHELVLDTNQQLCESLFNRCEERVIAARPYRTLVRLYTEAVDEFPAHTAIEKMECHHMAYSASYHTNAAFDCLYGIPMMAPLQSVAAFGLHLATLNLFRSYKLDFDLQSVMNASLSALPYDHEAYNKARVELECELLHRVPQNVVVNKDITEWQRAVAAEKADTRCISTEPEIQRSQQESASYPQEYVRASFANLRVLMKQSPALEQEVGIALWYRLKHLDPNHGDVRYIYNKITSLLDQLRIIGRTAC